MNTKLLKTLWGVEKAGLILTVMLCVAIFCGCAGEVADSAASARENEPGEGGIVHELGTFEGLSAETEGRILQDYFDVYIKTDPDNATATVNDIWVDGYYGTYNGCVVLTVRGPWGYPAVMVEATIAGVKFLYDYSRSPKLWKDGQFYYELEETTQEPKLRKAYDSKLLTQEDLQNIASYLNFKE